MDKRKLGKRFAIGAVFLISIFLFTGSICLAADSKTITLKPKPLKIKAEQFYIKEVIDARQDKSSIGFTHIGMFNKKVPLLIAGDLEKAIQSLMDRTFIPAETKIPIIIRVDILNISEWTGIAAEYGKLEMKLEFYRERDGKVAKVFEKEWAVENQIAGDATYTYEPGIRKALENIMKDFVASDWESKEEELIDYAQLRNPAPEAWTLESSFELSHHNAVLLKYSGGLNATGLDLSFWSYGMNNDVGKGILSDFYLETQTIQKNGYTYTWVSFGEKIGVLNRLGDSGWHTLFQSSIPFVFEIQNNKTQFSIGLKLEENLVLIPENNSGFMLYAGAYQYLSTSKIYSYDLGFKLGAGFQF